MKEKMSKRMKKIMKEKINNENGKNWRRCLRWAVTEINFGRRLFLLPLDFYFSVGRKQNNKKINAKTNIRPTFNNSPAHCCCLYFFPFLFSFPIEGGGGKKGKLFNSGAYYLFLFYLAYYWAPPISSSIFAPMKNIIKIDGQK